MSREVINRGAGIVNFLLVSWEITFSLLLMEGIHTVMFWKGQFLFIFIWQFNFSVLIVYTISKT